MTRTPGTLGHQTPDTREARSQKRQSEVRSQSQSQSQSEARSDEKRMGVWHRAARYSGMRLCAVCWGFSSEEFRILYYVKYLIRN